jgi:hypothetical protein
MAAEHRRALVLAAMGLRGAWSQRALSTMVLGEKMDEKSTFPAIFKVPNDQSQSLSFSSPSIQIEKSNMENANQQQLSNASNLDEWGEYAGNKELVDICQDGVMEAVQKHNPAITSVSVRFRSLRGENVDIDWEAAGLCVGKSLHLRRLLVDFEGPQERIQSFCEGMVLNRSIEALEVHFDGDDVNFLEETIQSLQPFFSSINKLVSVKFVSGYEMQERFIPTNGIQMAIDACQSLKSITIDTFCDVGALAQSICRKPGLSHVSFHDSRISHSTCIQIKNMLLNETCTLKSFVFDVVEVPDKLVMTAREYRKLYYMSPLYLNVLHFSL